MTLRKMELILHIGYHRTGTSAIQNFLWENRQVLAKHGVLYPEFPWAGPTHFELALSFNSPARQAANAVMLPPAKKSPYNFIPTHSPAERWTELAQVAKAAGLPKVVVSTECFLEWLDPALVAQTIDTKLFIPKIKVYLRPQADWLESVYAQVIKDREFRWHHGMARLPQNSQLDYAATINQWAKAFGSKAIQLDIYHAPQDPADLSKRFLTEIGAEAAIKDPAIKFSQKVNASLSPEATLVLKQLNRYDMNDPLHYQALELLREIEPQIPQNPKARLLTRQAWWQLNSAQAKGNQELAKQFLHRPDLFPDVYEPAEFIEPEFYPWARDWVLNRLMSEHRDPY